MCTIKKITTVCILHSNTSDIMKAKFILKYTFLLLSLIFVVDRSVHCFNRFLAEPQAIEIKMSDGTNEIMPHFTFCSEEILKSVVLNCKFLFNN